VGYNLIISVLIMIMMVMMMMMMMVTVIIIILFNYLLFMCWHNRHQVNYSGSIGRKIYK